MKCFVVLSAFIISTVAKPQQQYGVPQEKPQMNFQFGSLDAVSSSSPQFSQSFVNPVGGMGDGPKVYKHISIHIAPREEFDETPMKRIIRPMEKPDKIVNIIFVKAPSHTSSQQTEVILPSQPETRTVVYVLLKRPGNDNNVQIRQPKPTTPSKPVVFFIKYGRDKSQGVAEGSGSSVSAPVPISTSPSGPSEYGVPPASSASSATTNESDNGSSGYQR